MSLCNYVCRNTLPRVGSVIIYPFPLNDIGHVISGSVLLFIMSIGIILLSNVFALADNDVLVDRIYEDTRLIEGLMDIVHQLFVVLIYTPISYTQHSISNITHMINMINQ